MITTTDRISRGPAERVVRYAVVGLGWIAQIAVLPAFANASNTSRLAALISGNAEKRRKLGRRYRVPLLHSYEEYDACLRSGEIDAVYIALPNDQHREYAVRAAEAGIHVLCEKPMAVTERQCLDMIEAARANNVKLMIAYRLHFDPANMLAVDIARSGRLGDVRVFHSIFSMRVKDDENIRVQPEHGGGTLYDIGIYCINAARYLFQDEPIEVFGMSAPGSRSSLGLDGVDEMTSAILRFPGDRHAVFTSSFGVNDVSTYRIVGTTGELQAEPAYQFQGPLKIQVTTGGRTQRKRFREHDQFAPLLMHFSDCILRGGEPEPSGVEGLADVRIINALYDSARQGRPILMDEYVEDVVMTPIRRPNPEQSMQVPKPRRPRLINVKSPAG